MSSPEIPNVPVESNTDKEQEQIAKKLKIYFEKVEENWYYQDPGSEDAEMDFKELQKIRKIVAGFADQDFSPAYEYLDDRQKNLEKYLAENDNEAVKDDWKKFMIERSKMELTDVIELKEALIIE